MGGQEQASVAQVHPREAFFSAMSELQADFAAAAADIDEREAALKAALESVRLELRNGIGETVLAPSHPLALFMNDFNVKLAAILLDWLDQIDRYDRNTAFRKGFTDSLVVFVLGKVKAGKSSLGNYMAYECSTPEVFPASGTVPEFFTAAMVKGTEGQPEAAVKQGGCFRVGARETTTAIQGFRIPGLTWVDSPGLHSVTPENGALASDYADVADLIIYPMHTGSPGRAGDLAELHALLRANKRFVVVITQCDRPEEDETSDGSIVQHLVMKDVGSRSGQVDYVRRAIARPDNSAELDILTLSVRYAEIHDSTPEALDESGIADFYYLLTEIARSEGVRRKREAPSHSLDHFVDLILGRRASDNSMSVAQVHIRLEELKNHLATASSEMKRRANQATSRVLNEIPAAVHKLTERYADDKNQADFERECAAELRRMVGIETSKAVRDLVKAAGGAVSRVTELTEMSGFLKFSDIAIEVKKTNRKLLGAAGGGVGGVLGLAALWFVPVVGPVLGGFAAAAAVAAGGAAGRAAGSALGADWKEFMKVRDNRNEVEASAVKAMQEAGKITIEKFFQDTEKAVIFSVGKRQDLLLHEIDKLTNILKTKVHSNG